MCVRTDALLGLGGLVLILASLLVVGFSHVTATPLIAAPVIAAPRENGNPVNRAMQAALHSVTANSRVQYSGTLVTTLTSNRLDYEKTVAVTNTPGTRPEREVLSVSIDGDVIFENGEPAAEDETVEMVQRTVPSGNTNGVEGPRPTGGAPPFDSGRGSLAYSPLLTVTPFQIVDTELFARNYLARELSTEGIPFLGRPAIRIEIVPTDPELPSYELTLDLATLLPLESKMRLSERDNYIFTHRFTSIDIQSGALPAMGDVPVFRQPSPDEFELTAAEAAAHVPGFSMPRTEDLPEGFRLTGLSKRPGWIQTLQIDLSNGVEQFFVLARPAAFRHPDPVGTALDRVIRELGLENADAEVREAIREARRPHLERTFRTITEAEEEARGSDTDANVAWRRTNLGITRYSIYGSRLDLLVVGRVGEQPMLRTAELLLTTP